MSAHSKEDTMQLLNILLLLSVGLAIAHPDYSDSWQEFKQKFNKQYDSEEDEVAYNYIETLIFCLLSFRVTASQSGPQQFR